VTSAPTGGRIKYAKSHHKKAKGFGLSGRTRTTKNKSKHQPSNHANPLKQCKQSHPSTHLEETKEEKKKGTNFSNQKNIHRHHGLISKSDIDTLRGRRMGAATPYMASAFNPVNHHPWPRRRCIRSSGLAKTISV
jgi:hypothetical protein